MQITVYTSVGKKDNMAILFNTIIITKMCPFIKLVFLKDREQICVTVCLFLFSVIFILSVHTNSNKFFAGNKIFTRQKAR